VGVSTSNAVTTPVIKSEKAFAGVVVPIAVQNLFNFRTHRVLTMDDIRGYIKLLNQMQKIIRQEDWEDVCNWLARQRKKIRFADLEERGYDWVVFAKREKRQCLIEYNGQKGWKPVNNYKQALANLKTKKAA
jgi:hypothetical protein